VPRAAGRHPAIARGHAPAPWAAEAGRPRAAGPSLGSRGTLPAGGLALVAARPSCPASIRRNPAEAPPAPARRVPAAVPPAPARQTPPAEPPAPARQILAARQTPERGRHGERPAGRAANTPSSGSIPRPGADVNGNHAPAGPGRVSQRPLRPDRGPARGMPRRDAGGPPGAGDPPRPAGTGLGPWWTARPARTRIRAAPGQRRCPPRPGPGRGWCARVNDRTVVCAPQAIPAGPSITTYRRRAAAHRGRQYRVACAFSARV